MQTSVKYILSNRCVGPFCSGVLHVCKHPNQTQQTGSQTYSKSAFLKTLRRFISLLNITFDGRVIGYVSRDAVVE